MLLPGVAPLNELSEEYKDHVRRFCPILESYRLNHAASHLKQWVNGELQLAPLLDTSALLVRFRVPLAPTFAFCFES